METGDHANRPDRSGICHLSMGSRQESLSRSAEPVAALVLPVAVWMVVYDEDHHDNIRILQIHLRHVPICDGMSSGQLRETQLKKPLLYIRWVAGDGYVRGPRIIGHIDVIVSKNPLATTRCAGRKSEMSDWNGPGNFSNRQPRSSNRNPLHLIGAHLVHRFQSSNHIRRLDRVCRTMCERRDPG